LICLAETETVHEPEFPNENRIESLEDSDHLQNHDEYPDPPQPPEQIDPKVLILIVVPKELVPALNGSFHPLVESLTKALLG
jgi:hypothetical protein